MVSCFLMSGFKAVFLPNEYALMNKAEYEKWKKNQASQSRGEKVRNHANEIKVA
jgi:hypothetical protein